MVRVVYVKYSVRVVRYRSHRRRWWRNYWTKEPVHRNSQKFFLFIFRNYSAIRDVSLFGERNVLARLYGNLLSLCRYRVVWLIMEGALIRSRPAWYQHGVSTAGSPSIHGTRMGIWSSIKPGDFRSQDYSKLVSTKYPCPTAQRKTVEATFLPYQSWPTHPQLDSLWL